MQVVPAGGSSYVTGLLEAAAPHSQERRQRGTWGTRGTQGTQGIRVTRGTQGTRGSGTQ